MSEEPTKIQITVIGKNNKEETPFYVPYNPPEYTLTKGAQIAETGIPGLDSPILQFVRGTNEQLTLSLFFDTTEEGTDVREETEVFYRLVKIDSDLHAPPICKLSWGRPMGPLAETSAKHEKKFVGIVSNISQKFTLFKPDGTPLRAELEVTFKEYKSIKQQLDEMKLQSADHTKMRKVRRGDTLSRIAGDEYNDPGKWREIADANKINDPAKLVPGQQLLIPPLEELI